MQIWSRSRSRSGILGISILTILGMLFIILGAATSVGVIWLTICAIILVIGTFQQVKVEARRRAGQEGMMQTK